MSRRLKEGLLFGSSVVFECVKDKPSLCWVCTLLKFQSDHADEHTGDMVNIKVSAIHGTDMKKGIAHPKESRTISGVLLSALDMEDEIAHSIYQDYMDRNNWPAGIKDDVFEEIRKNLTILLNDTQKHRNIIRALQSKLGTDHG